MEEGSQLQVPGALAKKKRTLSTHWAGVWGGSEDVDNRKVSATSENWSPVIFCKQNLILDSHVKAINWRMYPSDLQ
jgi:hypothetical protein